jgi:hypothetical protein
VFDTFNMDLQTIETLLTVLEDDKALEVENALGRRNGVIDLLSFISSHPRASHTDGVFDAVDKRLDAFKNRLTAINARLFERLRTDIQQQHYTPDQLRLEFSSYTDYRPDQRDLHPTGADDLDTLLDGILDVQTYAYFTEPVVNMIPYVPTPARVVLEAIDKLDLKPDDIFYDLGSGLGRVVILANLMSGAQAKGVEINAVLDEHAREFANRLALSNVTFIKADVREVDFSDGTVFFMYTPFTGGIMDAVLDKLRQEALKRPLRICTYGPCTMSVAQQTWLHTEAVDINNPFDPVIFHSQS